MEGLAHAAGRRLKCSGLRSLAPIMGEVTRNCDGTMLRGEERKGRRGLGGGLLRRLVLHYKDKLYRTQVDRRPGQPASLRDMETDSAPFVDISDGPIELESGRRVVWAKRFGMEPMTMDECATQMDELGHTFFLFRNRAGNGLSLLYRRLDGDLGLIEPEGPPTGLQTAAPAS